MTDRRRQGFSDRNNEDEQGAPPSADCCAHGCPMPAGLIREGQRFCCVHMAVTDWNDFPAATAEIRKRMPLVDAIALLRQPGSRMDAQAVADALDLWPTLALQVTPYKVLLEAESIMRRECLTGHDALYRPAQRTA